jgi:16S rRNA (guanine(966)-N(2))-methyltransferase RsmD
LRIISGKYKGKILRPPKNLRARPTTDFAKEALFNILYNKLDFTQIRVADLFSGTGSIGLEFASREAGFVDMVERDHVNYEFIRKMITELKFTNARVIRTDVFTFIDHYHESYDLVFADPPFDMEGTGNLPGLIMNSALLNPGGCFILEHSKKSDYMNHPYCFDQREYGSVHFSFFRKPE